MTSTATATTAFHIGLHTSDIARAVRFYRTLFGIEPKRDHPEVAKFEIASPPLVLVLYPAPRQPGGALNHVGVRVPDTETLVAMQRRLEEAGIATQRQEGVECCYSRQTKFWVTDPDQVMSDSTRSTKTSNTPASTMLLDSRPDATGACMGAQDRRRLAGSPRVQDGALDEVRLEGSFNATIAATRMPELLREVLRVLQPGGRLAVHALVGDKPPARRSCRVWRRSCNASLSRRNRFSYCAAGFAGVFCDKLGDIHCFSVGGVELHEMQMVAWKPSGGAWPFVKVVYKGPYEEITDDDGMTYRRGEQIAVSPSRRNRFASAPPPTNSPSSPEGRHAEHCSRPPDPVACGSRLGRAARRAVSSPKRIDAALEHIWKAEKITPAPKADDAEFLRPRPTSISRAASRAFGRHAFLEDRSPDERTRLIGNLLREPRFAGHFAQVWRAELVPETTSDPQAGILRQGFEAWLTERLARASVTIASLGRELLSVPLPTQSSSAVAVLRDHRAPQPALAFTRQRMRSRKISPPRSRDRFWAFASNAPSAMIILSPRGRRNNSGTRLHSSRASIGRGAIGSSRR
ncbi:MAG: VOC family protein [Gemmataceae bacterium]